MTVASARRRHGSWPPMQGSDGHPHPPERRIADGSHQPTGTYVIGVQRLTACCSVGQFGWVLGLTSVGACITLCA